MSCFFQVVYMNQTDASKSADQSVSKSAQIVEEPEDRTYDSSPEPYRIAEHMRNVSTRQRALIYAKKLRKRERKLQRHLKEQVELKISRLQKIKEKIKNNSFETSNLEQINLSGNETMTFDDYTSMSQVS